MVGRGDWDAEVARRGLRQIDLGIGNRHDLAPRVARVAGQVGVSGPAACAQDAIPTVFAHRLAAASWGPGLYP